MQMTDIFYHYFLYDGAVTDILINYILITLYLLTTSNVLSPNGDRILLVGVHFIICSIMQLMCWVIFDAYGVSLVWCGLMGCQIVILKHQLVGKDILICK